MATLWVPTTKWLFGIRTKWNKKGEGNDSEQLKNIIYRWKESLGYPFNFFCHMFSSNMSPEVTRINHFCHTNVSPLVKILCKDNKRKISPNYDQVCVILFLCVIFCYNFHQCKLLNNKSFSKQTTLTRLSVLSTSLRIPILYLTATRGCSGLCRVKKTSISILLLASWLVCLCLLLFQKHLFFKAIHVSFVMEIHWGEQF